jgi:hypothetical protein
MNEAAPYYEIRVQGHLAARRFRRFEGLTVAHQPNGDTVLVGPVRDQPALYGLLLWLHNLGVPLLSVRRIEERSETVMDGDRAETRKEKTSCPRIQMIDLAEKSQYRREARGRTKKQRGEKR